ncbi:MAG: hypothetical protein E3J86_03950 [Candidatus Thorarchaeota archaeon]|nr:MAG: hypothetical protein E3J86_03950 [Candidatus Thorarchaeota archaeon]
MGLDESIRKDNRIVRGMDDTQKETLFMTFKSVIDSIITDKRENPKNTKRLDSFEGRINIGLHVEEDEILWINLVAKDGEYIVGRDALEEYDLELISDPEDLMFFCSGQYSVIHMMMKRNRFGKRKLRFKGRAYRKLLALPKILVLDKIEH